VVVATGDRRIAVEVARTGQTITALPIEGDVQELAASARHVAAIVKRGNEQWLWIADLVNDSLQAGPLSQVHGYISCLAVGGNARYVAIGRTDGTIEVRSRTAGPWQLTSSRGQSEMITSLAFSERGDLVAGAQSGRVSLWKADDLQSDQAIELAGFVAPVHAVAIDDVEHSVAASSATRVLLWDSHTGQALGDVLVPTGPDDSAMALAFLPTGRKLAVAMTGAHVIQLEVDPREWQRKACALANRELAQDPMPQDARSTPKQRSCALHNEELRRTK